MRRGGASPPQPAQPRPLWRSSLTQPHSMLSFPPHAPCRSSSCWAVVWGRCVSMTRKPRRISVKSISTTTCPGELEPTPHHQGRRLPSVVRRARPFSSLVPHLLCRIQPQCTLPLWAGGGSDPGPCVLQNPVSCVQPQWGLFRLFGCSSEPHFPGGLLSTRHRQQGHEPGSWQAAAVGHKNHEAAGTGLPCGSLWGQAHSLHSLGFLKSLFPLFALVSSDF